jgi:hypothetical protein
VAKGIVTGLRVSTETGSDIKTHFQSFKTSTQQRALAAAGTTLRGSRLVGNTALSRAVRRRMCVHGWCLGVAWHFYSCVPIRCVHKTLAKVSVFGGKSDSFGGSDVEEQRAMISQKGLNGWRGCSKVLARCGLVDHGISSFWSRNMTSLGHQDVRDGLGFHLWNVGCVHRTRIHGTSACKASL